MSNGQRPYLQLRFAKRGRLRFVGHLDLMRVVDRAVRRADIPVSYTEGYNRHARISVSPPPPSGTESAAELCVIDLRRDLSPEQLAQRLSEQLPAGIQILNATGGWRGSRSPLADLSRMTYEAQLDIHNADVGDVRAAIEDIRAKDSIEIQRSSKGKSKTIDMRPRIRKLELRESRPPVLVMGLYTGDGPTPKPREIIQVINQQLEGDNDGGSVAIEHLTRTHLS